MPNLQRSVTFERGHDCLNFECAFGSARCAPGKGGSHGVHGLQIRFTLKGEEGAVQFLLYTGWLPLHIQPSGIGYHLEFGGKDYTMPADLGYHSRTPKYEGQEARGDCEYLDGAPCYYDGSGLNASAAMYALVNGGDTALWEFLTGYYDCVFHGGKFPTPAEYPKKLR